MRKPLPKWKELFHAGVQMKLKIISGDMRGRNAVIFPQKNHFSADFTAGDF